MLGKKGIPLTEFTAGFRTKRGPQFSRLNFISQSSSLCLHVGSRMSCTKPNPQSGLGVFRALQSVIRTGGTGFTSMSSSPSAKRQRRRRKKRWGVDAGRACLPSNFI